MENSFNINYKFVCTWQIKNLRHSTMQTGESLVSPKFTAPQFQNTTWHLEIYPKGEKEEVEDCITCYMHRGDDSGPEKVDMEYNIQICPFRDSDTRSGKYFFPKNAGYGYKNFCSRYKDELLDSFTLIWEIYFNELRTVKNKHKLNNFLSSCLKANTDFLKVVEDIKKLNIDQSQGCFYEAMANPVKCFAQTKICYDKNHILWPISSFVRGTKSEERIQLLMSKKYPSLLICLCKNPALVETKIDVKIHLVGSKVKKKLLLSCDLRVINKAGEILSLCQDEHTFIAGKEDEIWTLSNCIDDSEIMTAKNSETSSSELYLRMNFTFSIGKIYSEIVSFEYTNLRSNDNSMTDTDSIVSNKIFPLYKEKKLCDMILRVNNTTFDVHKVVLGASSPVFAAMFMSDMSESKDKIVDIVDLEEETVSEMINYMYTGSLKELNFEDAHKLYAAGDKYHISPLVNECRTFMLNHINAQDIYLILHIVNTYSDLILENEAVKFIKLNKPFIFNSPEWKIVEEGDAKFAANISRQVSLLNKRNM